MAKTDPIEVQAALKGIAYPADRDQLVDQAKRNRTREELVDQLAHLRQGEYRSPTEVETEIFR